MTWRSTTKSRHTRSAQLSTRPWTSTLTRDSADAIGPSPSDDSLAGEAEVRPSDSCDSLASSDDFGHGETYRYGIPGGAAFALFEMVTPRPPLPKVSVPTPWLVVESPEGEILTLYSPPQSA